MESEKAFAAKCEEYAEAQGLRELMHSLMRMLLQQQPADPLQCLIDHLRQQLQLEGHETQPQQVEDNIEHRKGKQNQQERHQEGQGQQGEQKQQRQQLKGPLLRLVVMGLPGSGRREVSRRLAELWSLPLLSAGDLLRMHAAKYPKGEAARAIASKTLGIRTALKHLQQY